MTTKIDISSLDVNTKKKIKELGKRSKQIQKGVSRSVYITPKTIKFKVEAEWEDGDSCYLPNFDCDYEFYGNADKAIENIIKTVKKAHEDFKKKIDAEIKTITAFSDKIADKLGVDRTEFFDQYFLY